MNERIRRIMEQAIISVDGQLFGKTYVPDEFTEKFAELIVQECLLKINGAKIRNESYAELIERIKEDFGVEE